MLEQEIIEHVSIVARHLSPVTHWKKTPNGPRMIHDRLKKKHVEGHCNGGPGIGLGFIRPGEDTTLAACIDLDSHKGEIDWADMVAVAAKLCRTLEEMGLQPNPVRSSGGHGIHIWLLFEEPQDAYSVRWCLVDALTANSLKNASSGLIDNAAEVFPKQDSVPNDGHGSMVILPFNGESVPLDPETLEIENFETAISRDWRISAPVKKRERPAREQPKPSALAETPAKLAELRSALQAIPNEGDKALSYDDWRNVLFGIHHATGGSEEGYALALEFSERAPHHDEAFMRDRVWECIRDDREGKVVTARTIYSMARKHGWQEDVLNDFEDLGPQAPESSQVEGVAAGAGAPGARFRIESDTEFTSRPPPTWHIKGVLPKAGVVLLIGQSTAGKSFIALDMAGAISRGIPWRGELKTRKGRVLYIAAEGVGGFRNRMVAYRMHNKISTTGIDVLADAPSLLKQTDSAALIEAMNQAGPYDVVFIDTLAQVTPGANENSGEEMGKALSHAQATQRATGATVVLVHHVGKDATKGARGWSGLKGNADAEITVERDGEDRLIDASKIKDGKDGARYSFKLQVVPIGMDEDGDVIDSCVVEHGEELRKRAKGERKLAPRQQQALNVLTEMSGLSGGAVDRAKLIAAIRASTPEDAKLAKSTIDTALEGLATKGIVSLRGSEVTITGFA